MQRVPCSHLRSWGNRPRGEEHLARVTKPTGGGASASGERFLIPRPFHRPLSHASPMAHFLAGSSRTGRHMGPYPTPHTPHPHSWAGVPWVGVLPGERGPMSGTSPGTEPVCGVENPLNPKVRQTAGVALGRLVNASRSSTHSSWITFGHLSRARPDLTAGDTARSKHTPAP